MTALSIAIGYIACVAFFLALVAGGNCKEESDE